MRVGLRGGRLFRRRHLGAQALQLFIERRFVCEHGGKLFVALAQARFERLQLLGRLRRGRPGPRQCRRVESEPRRRARDAAVGARQPIGHVE